MNLKKREDEIKVYDREMRCEEGKWMELDRECIRFGPKKEELTGGGITFHNEELRSSYSLPHTVRAIKLRRM
jgi:hypothetical protein